MGTVSPEARAQGLGEPRDVYCSGQYTGTVFSLGPPESSGNRPRTGQQPQAPVELSERIRREYPFPTGTIRVNPGWGLVGTESWFWLEGVSSEPSTQTTDAFGAPVHVESRVANYDWSFGDGATMRSASPGKPYPQRSDVRHIFQRASADSGHYTVEVRFRYAVRYSSDGANWTDLPDVNRTASAGYRVREAQALIAK